MYPEDEISCPDCADRMYLDADIEHAHQALCTSCSYVLPVHENTKYASAGTGTTWKCYLSPDGSFVEKIYLENEPLELLTTASARLAGLRPEEIQPNRLLPLLKMAHDALRDRLRDTISYAPESALTAQQKQEVADDPPHGRYNLVRVLYEMFPQAFPGAWKQLQAQANNRRVTVEQIRFVRNKDEHVLAREWPTPAYVHTDPKAHPRDKSNVLLNRAWLGTALQTSRDLIVGAVESLGYSSDQSIPFRNLEIQ